MNGFERRKEKKKEDIRSAAIELFNTYGFKRVSIADIAERAGVSKVTIYKYFGAKDEVIRDIVQNLLTEAVEKYRSVIESDLPFPEKLEYLVLDKADMAKDLQGEFVQAILSTDSKIRQFVEHIFKSEINQRLIDFFEEGKKEGYIDPGLSQEALLIYTEAVRNGLTARLSGDPEQNAEMLKNIMSLYLYGVMGKKDQATI